MEGFPLTFGCAFHAGDSQDELTSLGLDSQVDLPSPLSRGLLQSNLFSTQIPKAFEFTISGEDTARPKVLNTVYKAYVHGIGICWGIPEGTTC